MDNIEDVCSYYYKCEVNICPLDPGIADRNYISGEKVCRKILDYLEGKPTKLDEQIRKTEHIWKAKYGKKLEARLNSRMQIREAFRKAV